MKSRGAGDLQSYFSDTLITLRKVHKARKHNKRALDEYAPTIANLEKGELDLPFKLDDSSSSVLRGFTIDLRIFYNLIRKMLIIKLNSTKIWTRQFYSQDLSLIFMVLKPLDSVFSMRALVNSA